MEKIKRFCRENARILLALGAVLAFCAVLAALEPLGGAVYRITPEEMTRITCENGKRLFRLG